jgi:predicted MFS family arabinose efflux permease
VRAFAIIFTTGPSISLMLTPLLAGALVSGWGLRAPFVASACFSLVSVLFLLRLQPVPAPPDEPPDGAAGRGGYGGLLRVPGLPRLLVLQFLTFFALGMGTALLSLYLHDVKGYSEAAIPPLTSLTALGSISFATAVARSQRLAGAPVRAVAIAVAFAGVSYLLFLRAEWLPLALLGLTLRGGFFAAWPLYSAVLGEATPERLRPHVFAMGEILAGSGFVLAPVFAGRFYAIRPELPLLLAVAMIVPIVVALATTDTSGQGSGARG